MKSHLAYGGEYIQFVWRSTIEVFHLDIPIMVGIAMRIATVMMVIHDDYHDDDCDDDHDYNDDDDDDEHDDDDDDEKDLIERKMAGAPFSFPLSHIIHLYLGTRIITLLYLWSYLYLWLYLYLYTCVIIIIF